MFVSVTRLRIRSVRFMPFFAIAMVRTNRQLQRAEGFVVGELLVDRRLAFWTMTGWTDEAAMRAYRNSGPHRGAMPRLLDWCDEAAAVHWMTETAALPGWAEAHAKLKSEGFLTKVKWPSVDQPIRNFAEPGLTMRRRIVRPAAVR